MKLTKKKMDTDQKIIEFIKYGVGFILGVCAIILVNNVMYTPANLVVTEGEGREQDMLFIHMDGDNLAIKKGAVNQIVWMDGVISVVPQEDYVYSNVEIVE